MARFFFSAVGAGGHVNPLLPIAAELVRRGHTVGFGTSRHLERKVAPNVTHFFRLGVDLSEESTEKPREWAKFNDLRGSRRLTFALRNVLFPLGERTAGEILEIVPSFKPDVFVFDFMTFAASIVAEITGLPWATTTPVPGALQSRGAHPFGLALPYSDNRLRRSVLSLFWPLANMNSSLRYDRQFNRIRSGFGLPPVRNVFFNANLSRFLTLVLAPAEIEYPRRSWPPTVHFVGPGMKKGSASGDEPEWLKELPSSRPLIYATVGTSPNRGHTSYLDRLRRAIGGVDAHCVASCGTGMELPESSGNFRLESWVSHPLIMPRARMVIHQGGSSTLFETLAYGKPALATPFEDGHDENAERLRWTGAGTVVNPYKVSVPRLRESIRAVLESRTMRERAMAFGRRLEKYDAGRTGATLLEQLARTGEPVLRQ